MKLPKELKNKERREKEKPSSLTKSEKKIIEEYPVSEIMNQETHEPLPCPNCQRTEFLRGWEVKNKFFALCYLCGAVFSGDDEIIHMNEGDRRFWGSSALAIIGSPKSTKD
jgi:hypothetical protein